MGQVGARAASPLGLLREYIVALRRLLAGETVTITGRYVRLTGWPWTGRRLAAPGAGRSGRPAVPAPVRGVRRRHRPALPAPVAPGLRRPGPDRRGPPRRRPVGPHDIVVYVHAATGPGPRPVWPTSTGAGVTPRTEDIGAVGDAPAVAEAVRRWARPVPGRSCSSPRRTTPTPKPSSASSLRRCGPWSRRAVTAGWGGDRSAPHVPRAPWPRGSMPGPRQPQHRPTRLDGHVDLDGASFPVVGRRERRRHPAVPDRPSVATAAFHRSGPARRSRTRTERHRPGAVGSDHRPWATPREVEDADGDMVVAPDDPGEHGPSYGLGPHGAVPARRRPRRFRRLCRTSWCPPL